MKIFLRFEFFIPVAFKNSREEVFFEKSVRKNKTKIIEKDKWKSSFSVKL